MLFFSKIHSISKTALCAIRLKAITALKLFYQFGFCSKRTCRESSLHIAFVLVLNLTKDIFI